jgi:predicted MFS family arabinose efflux permease
MSPGTGDVQEAAVPVRAIAFLALAAFASAATMRITDALLPQIARDFDVTNGVAGRVVTAFAVSYGLMQAVFGPVGDRFGKYRVVTVATALSAFGAVACALAPTLDALTAARLLSGATAAAIIPLSIAWIGDTVPYAERQPVLARFLSGQILGLVFGQAAGGILGEAIGWHGAFWLIAALYILAASGLGFELACNARTRGGGRHGRSFAAGFRDVLSRPWARVVLLTVLIEGFAMFGAFVFVASYLHDRFGLSLALSGVVVATYGLGGLLYAATARRLLRALHERGLALAGGVLLCVGFLALALLPAWWLAVPVNVVLGLGFYMLHNTLQTHATQMAPEARGAAVAMFAAAFFIGQSIGVAATAAIVDTIGPRVAFVFAAVAVLALAAWFRGRLAHRN